MGTLSKLEYQEVECPLSMPSCLLMMTEDLVNLGDSNILPLSEKGAYIWELCTLYACVHYSLIKVKISRSKISFGKNILAHLYLCFIDRVIVEHDSYNIFCSSICFFYFVVVYLTYIMEKSSGKWCDASF